MSELEKAAPNGWDVRQIGASHGSRGVFPFFEIRPSEIKLDTSVGSVNPVSREMAAALNENTALRLIARRAAALVEAEAAIPDGEPCGYCGSWRHSVKHRHHEGCPIGDLAGALRAGGRGA